MTPVKLFIRPCFFSTCITGRGPTLHEDFLLVSGWGFHFSVDVYLYLWHVSYSSHIFLLGGGLM